VRALGAALLSLGGARAWALWAPEFSAAEQGGATLAEGADSDDESSGSRRASVIRWTSRRRMAAFGAGVALLGAGVVLGRTFGSRAPTPTASVSAAAPAAASPPTAAALAPPSAASPPVPSPSVPSPSVPSPPLGSAARPLANEAFSAQAAGAPLATGGESPSGGSHRGRAAVSPPARPASPRPEIGSNNAPILP
jgi:hypothetical protein